MNIQCEYESDSDTDSFDATHSDNEIRNSPLLNQEQQMDINWQKPVLLTGEAGCGKSYTINSIVNTSVQTNVNVLVAVPTGFLASVFRAALPEQVCCETVHAAFKFRVEDVSLSINWQLSQYDIIIIDELSMILDIIFHHILKTIHVLLCRPVLMVTGDAGQQQPFSQQTGTIMQLTSALDNSSFISNSYHYHLNSQHRVADVNYLRFLNTIRKWVPSQELLDQIQEGRVISHNHTFTHEDILHAYYSNPDSTIFTFTRMAANHINDIVIKASFNHQQPLAHTQLDCELPRMLLYAGMRVVITQKRDKANGVVNGQTAILHAVHYHSVYLKLNNEKIVPIYPVTITRNNPSITLYPFCPAYAMTTCKAQGQTLPKVVLWFDIDTIPPGTAYVALSRVKCENDICFLQKLKPQFFNPVSRLSHLL